MTSYFGSDFDSVARWLRRTTGLQFLVRTKANMTDEEGNRILGEVDWESRTHGWVVYINRSQDHDGAIHSLIHEVAHVQDFQEHGYREGHSKQHSAGWGKIYSKLYNQYFDAQDRNEL